MRGFSNPFSFNGLAELSGRLATRMPRAYLGLALAVTLAGYAALALFPLLTLIAALTIATGVTSAASWQEWLGVVIWFAVGAGSGLLSYQLLSLRIPVPSGLGIKADKAPKLYELIDELSEVYNAPMFDRVVVHDDFELTIVPCPRFGLPLVKSYVLRIGLPMMQALSPEQFRLCLAGRLGQYSAVHNRLTHFIYRWRQYCQQYRAVYQKRNAPLYLPFKWFFRLYTPLCNALCIHAVHQDELEADRYVLEIVNDDRLADAIKRTEVSRAFLKAKYWPKIHAMLQKQGAKMEHLPHASMANVLRKGLTDAEFNDLLARLRQTGPTFDDTRPSYAQRMENIGHLKDAPPLPLVETAAVRYLGKMSGPIVQMLDKMWLKKHASGGRAKKKAHTPETAELATSNEQRLAVLKKQLAEDKQDEHLLWQVANLTEEVEGKAAAIEIYKRLLKLNPGHARTIFAVGRILLSQDDPAGVDVLEKAVALDSGCQAQAYWLLANYFKKAGQKDKAKYYLEKAAGVSTSSAA